MTDRDGARAGRLVAELGVIVLGVLIAFWVENYREYREDRQEERVLLEALREEYAENRIRIGHQMDEYEQRRAAQRKLIELGKSAADLSVDSASVLWVYAVRGFLATRIEAPPSGGGRAIELGYRADGDYTAVLGTPEFDRLLSWGVSLHTIYEIVLIPLDELLDETEARLAEVLEG